MNSNSQKVYVDTNIFCNVFFSDTKRKDLVEASRKFLEEIIKCKYYLVISELTIFELVKVTGLNREVIIKEFFKSFSAVNKLKIVKKNRKIAEDAVYFSSSFGIHIVDAFHAIIAKMNDCWLVIFDRMLKDGAKKYKIKTFDPRDLTP